jgi:hypothetical membrane protein
MTRLALSRLGILTPIGAALFTLAWFVLGPVSPGYRLFDLVIEPYSAISQPVSGLGLGATGPWMNAAFVLSGILVLVGTVAATRAWPRTGPARTAGVLTSLVGVGMIVDGLFTLESVLLHLAGFLLAVVLPPVGFVLAGPALRRSSPRLSTLLLVAGSLALALFVVFQVIFDPYSAGDNTGVAGLVQRLLITVVLATVSVLGLAAFRGKRAVA